MPKRKSKRPVAKPRVPLDPPALLQQAEDLVRFHAFAWQRGRPTAASKGRNVIPELARLHGVTVRTITRCLATAKRQRRGRQRTHPVSYQEGMVAAFAGKSVLQPRLVALPAALEPKTPVGATATGSGEPTSSDSMEALAQTLVRFMRKPQGAPRVVIDLSMTLLDALRALQPKKNPNPSWPRGA